MFLNFCRLSVGDNSWRIRNTTYWFCWGYSRGGLWPWVLWWWVEGHSVTRVYHSGWEVQREASLSGGWTLQDIEVVCNRCLPKQWLFTPWLNDKLLNYYPDDMFLQMTKEEASNITMIVIKRIYGFLKWDMIFIQWHIDNPLQITKVFC